MFRQSFFAALTLLTVSFAAHAMEHAHDTPKEIQGGHATLHGTEVAASPLAAEELKTAVATEEVKLTVPGSKDTYRFYIARPKDAKGKLPAVVLIHEWWGLNENIESMARKLAAEGYIAGAIDVYGKPAATTPAQAAQMYAKATANQKLVNTVVEKASDVLLSRKDVSGSRVGVMGWCFGGNQTLQAAVHLGPKVAAGVVYYGISIRDESQLKKIKAPILGLYGEKDQLIPVNTIEEMYGKLKKQGLTVDYHVYPGAGHAFANPSAGEGKSYFPDAAKDAWTRTVAWLKSHHAGK